MSLSNLQSVQNYTGGLLLSLPYFTASKSVNSTVSNTPTYINTYDSKSGDLADQFDLATGKFTPTRSGVYLYTAKCFFDVGGPSTQLFFLSITTNGAYNNTTISNHQDDYAGGPLAPVVSGTLFSTAGISQEVQIFQDVANPLSVTAIQFTAVMLVAF